MLKTTKKLSFKANRLIFFEGAKASPEAEDVFKKVSTDQLDDKKLTKQEVQDVKEKRTTIPKLAAARDKAKAEFANLKNTLLLDGKIRNEQDLADFKKRFDVDKLESPALIKEAIENLKKLPEELEKAKKTAEEQQKQDAKELAPDAPERAEFKQEMLAILEKNLHLIHDPGIYRDWIDQEANKEKNSVAIFKKLKMDFEGKESKDPNGLHPRRQLYQSLELKFKKHGLENPRKSPIIKNLPKEDREKFLKNIDSLESHFHNVSDELYDKNTIQKTMKEALLSDSLGKQEQLLALSKKVQEKEEQAYTYLDGKMTIQGVTIRKMSQKGRDQFLSFYKNQEIENRLVNVQMWPSFIETEAALAEDLLEVYTNKEGKIDIKGFKKALGSFEELNFMEKEAAIKEHQKMVDKKESDEILHYNLTEKAAIAKVTEAKRKKIISEKTAANYEKWFKNPDNFKNAESRKVGDLKAIEKEYEKLKDTTPYIKPKEKNLAAFEAEKQKFAADMKKLREINPKMTAAEIAKWQDKYDEGSWKERQKIHTDLLKEQKDQKELQAMEKTINENATDKSKEKLKSKEKAPESLSELKALVLELTNNEQGLQANIELMAFLQEAKRNNEYEQYKDNSTIKFLWGVIQAAINSFGMGELLDEDEQISAIEDKVKNVAESDENIKESLLESYLHRRNLEGVEQNINRHNQVEDTEERAKKESLEHASGEAVEADLTEDFYQQTDSDTILSKEGSGQEVTNIELDESSTSEEIQALREKMVSGDQARIDTTKEGLSDVRFKIAGQEISIDQAESKMDESDAALDDELATMAQERMANSLTGKEKDFATSVQGRAAAIRAARELREKQAETEKLKR